MTSYRRFELHRDKDISQVSGLGIVADGIQFRQDEVVFWPDGSRTVLPEGWCLVRWRGKHRSTVLWPSLEDVVAVNGHGGATRIVWVDAHPVEITGPPVLVVKHQTTPETARPAPTASSECD